VIAAAAATVSVGIDTHERSGPELAVELPRAGSRCPERLNSGLDLRADGVLRGAEIRSPSMSWMA